MVEGASFGYNSNITHGRNCSWLVLLAQLKPGETSKVGIRESWTVTLHSPGENKGVKLKLNAKYKNLTNHFYAGFGLLIVRQLKSIKKGAPLTT